MCRMRDFTCSSSLVVAYVAALVERTVRSDCTGWVLSREFGRMHMLPCTSWNGLELVDILRDMAALPPPHAHARKAVLQYCKVDASASGGHTGRVGSASEEIFGGEDWTPSEGRFSLLRFKCTSGNSTLDFMRRMSAAIGQGTTRPPQPTWKKQRDEALKKDLSNQYPIERDAEWLSSTWPEQQAMRVVLDVMLLLKLALEEMWIETNFAMDFAPRMYLKHSPSASQVEMELLLMHVIQAYLRKF